MKTRSKFGTESISPVLRRKQSKTARLEASSGHDTDVSGVSFKGPQSVIKTPKLSRKRDSKAKTPSRDDVLCSQHFDSQTVVGWDCNSPASVRNLTEKKNVFGEDNDGVEDLVLRLIGEEPEENIRPNRGTPPLLGLWREKPEEKQKCSTSIHQRLRKRPGRQRKKSAISAVSHELLEQLTVALNKCSDVDKETEGRKAEGELFLSDINELEELDENENTRAVQNVSSDLFESFKEEMVDAAKLQAKSTSIKTGGDLTLNKSKPVSAKTSDEFTDELGDATWSDDELFGNDSFIIHATQIPIPTKGKYSSPAQKRKANDKEFPKSKCTRYALSVSKDSTEKNIAASENNSRTYTALVSKQNNSIPLKSKEICDGKTSRFACQLSLGSSSGIVTGTSKYANNVTARSKQSTNNSKCMIPSTSTVGFGMQQSDNHARVVSSTAQKSTNNAYMSSQAVHNSRSGTNVTRSGSFKKYNSFSGSHVQSNVTVLNRQRSMSGNNNMIPINRTTGDNKINTDNQAHCQQIKTSTQVNNCQDKLVGFVPNDSKKTVGQQRQNNHTLQKARKSDNQNDNNGNLQKCSTSQRNDISGLKPRAVGGFVSKNDDNSNKKSLKAENFPRSMCSSVQEGRKPITVQQIPNKSTASATELKTDVLDTIISDDLLWQLAEPDNILESQAELNTVPEKVCNNRSKSMVGSNVESVRSAQHTVLRDVSGQQDSTKKKFTFKHSQKPGNQRNASKLPATNTAMGKMEYNNKPAMTRQHIHGLDINIKSTKNTVTEGKVISKRTEDTVKKNASKDNAFSEDLFSDDDDLDSEGLTEDQIFAMLDEVEMMATQRQVGPSQSALMDRQKQSDTAAYKSNQANVAENKTNKQTGINSNTSQRKICATENYHVKDKHGKNIQESTRESHNLKSSQEYSSSQGQPSSQGQINHSQGQMNSSQGQISSSQGQMSSSQAKYSAAEIERKKQMAIERRQKRLQESQIPKS